MSFPRTPFFIAVMLVMLASGFERGAYAQSCGVLRPLVAQTPAVSLARCVSADDRFVGGGTGPTFPQITACIWRDGGDPLILGVTGGRSFVTDISDDGNVAVGTSFAGGGSRAFRWSASGGVQFLPSLGGANSSCAGVSADGTVAVGSSTIASSPILRACHWTTAGVQALGSLGGTYSEARGASADGTVIVGLATDAAGGTTAFRWTPTSGMQAPLQGLTPYSEAYGVSSDGETLVGIAIFGSLGQAFRWSAAGGLVNVAPSGSLSWAYAVSDDGSVVVGEYETVSFEHRPFSWTAAQGPLDLAAPAGSFGISAGVTADGAVAVGSYDSTAWLTHLPVDAGGTVYCAPAQPNSTGCNGDLVVTGDPLVMQNAFSITARNLPPGAFGYVLLSRTQSPPTPVMGSQGEICLGGSIGRLVGAGQVLESGVAGRFDVAIDLTALPAGAGASMIGSGEAWNFQAWYRDRNPGATSNLTSALEVTFL